MHFRIVITVMSLFLMVVLVNADNCVDCHKKKQPNISLIGN